MAGAFAGGAPARVRIKGKTASCVRFCLIAVSFMMAWVLITSQLGYYSNWFGPQILLELSLAFNVPAIPVLIISGQVEKVLDRHLGPVKSMSLRLLFGLAGCTACTAAFPFLPGTHASLLWLVAVLGMLSAIAFSTSYQLVQWFRHADIIALGIGGVGTGPLVLLLQLALGVGANPERWQWIAMFEITALTMTLGLVSASSLFAQYWKVMTGEEEYMDPRQPLLPAASHSPEDRAEARHMRLARAATEHQVLPPDPTAYGVSAMLSPGAVTWPDEDESGVPRLHSAASASRADLSLMASRSGRGPRQPRPCLRHSNSTPGHLPAAAPAADVSLGGAQWPNQPAHASTRQPYGQGSAAWHAETSQGLYAPDTGGEVPGGEADTIDAPPGTPPAAQRSAFENIDDCVREDVLDAMGGAEAGAGKARDAPLTLQEENMAVWRDAWQVLGAFLVSVTITYCLFPFFTYVRSSGLIGDELPKVLFFVRIFSDLVGRFIPRCKALMLHSPSVLAALALLKVGMCVVFFVYIKAPARFQHDALSVAFILLIWLLGGYINTIANILAPALVQPALVGRASALLALIFQVAHFAGLLLAVLLAYLLYGDVVG